MFNNTSLKFLSCFILLHFLLPLQAQKKSSFEFVENMGQVVDMNKNKRMDILFSSSGSSGNIYIAKTGISFIFSDYKRKEKSSFEIAQIYGIKNKLSGTKANTYYRIDLDFIGANAKAEIRKEFPLPGEFNYYYGHCREGIKGVKAYKKITL